MIASTTSLMIFCSVVSANRSGSRSQREPRIRQFRRANARTRERKRTASALKQHTEVHGDELLRQGEDSGE